MFTVKFFSYCGMSFTLGDGLTRKEAETLIRRRLRLARYRSRPVQKIGKGRWEILTPDDAAGVSDGEGILSVRRSR